MARLKIGKARTSKSEADDAATAADPLDAPPMGISPNPKTNFILADIALRGGGMLLRRSVERGLLGIRYSPGKAKQIVKGRGISQTLVGTALARVATRSVPGALIVGGGLLAKALYDRRQGRKAALKGEAGIQEMADKGSKS